MTDIRWYAVQTGANAERSTHGRLKRIPRLHLFYPHTRVKRRAGRRRRLVQIERPLFRSYLFVGMEEGASFAPIVDTEGVIAIVSFVGAGGERSPVQIPDGVMDELFARADDEGFVATPRPPHWFRGAVGDRVRLEDDGPLFGLLAEIASLQDLERTSRIGVWIDGLGRRVLATVDAAKVHVAPKDAA